MFKMLFPTVSPFISSPHALFPFSSPFLLPFRLLLLHPTFFNRLMSFFPSPLHFPLPYCCKERCKMCLMCQSSFLFFFACSFFACTLYCKAKTNIFFLLPCVCERIKMTVLMFYYFIYVKQKHS